MMLLLYRYVLCYVPFEDVAHDAMQTIRDLGILRCQIGNEAIKAVTEHLPTQYNRRTLDSKSARAAYIQTLISDKQYPFIWEYFRPGNIPVGGAKLYYDDVSGIYTCTFRRSHP